jgi:serine protease Do
LPRRPFRKGWLLRAALIAFCAFAPVRPLPVHAEGFRRAIETALPRVVKLYGLGVGTQAGYGSGVLVSPDGLVLTVFSLLIDAEHIRAVTHDGTTYEANVVHRDAQRQLALLQLKARPLVAPGGAAPVASQAKMLDPFSYFEVACATPSVGDPVGLPCPDLQIGDWVVAAGNPFKVADGAEPVSIAHGVFSARTRLDARRKVKDFPYRGDVLVIDAITSNPGAPGSSLVDIEGRFVGMIGRVVVSNRTHTHFNYAIPRDVLTEFMREATNPAVASAARSARRSQNEEPAPVIDVGLRMARTGYKDLPPFVERVRKGSPAEKAGVLKDDLILSINNANVADVREFDERWRMLNPGEPIDLVIRRDRRIINVRLEPAAP